MSDVLILLLWALVIVGAYTWGWASAKHDEYRRRVKFLRSMLRAVEHAPPLPTVDVVADCWEQHMDAPSRHVLQRLLLGDITTRYLTAKKETDGRV